MPDESAFIRTIIDDPDSDGPRLVYADWLEERGETERAELIRVQVELAHLPENHQTRKPLEHRAARLLNRHGQKWVTEVADWIRDWTFERGVLSHVRVMGLDFARQGHTLFDRAPIVRVRLTDASGCVASLAKTQAFERLKELDIGYNGLRIGHLIDLTESTNLSELRSLLLDANPLQGLVARVLTPLRDLWHISIARVDLRDRNCEMLAGISFGKLTRMSVESNHIGSVGMQILMESEWISRLRELNLAHNPIQDLGVASLAATSKILHLVSLNLSATQLTDVGVASLANSSALGALESLDLSLNPIGRDGAKALVASKHLVHLRVLRVSNNQLDSGALRLLQRHFGKRLDLVGWGERFNPQT